MAWMPQPDASAGGGRRAAGRVLRGGWAQPWRTASGCAPRPSRHAQRKTERKTTTEKKKEDHLLGLQLRPRGILTSPLRLGARAPTPATLRRLVAAVASQYFLTRIDVT